MSTDLRQLMRELADDAPTMGDRIAMADVAYTGGRRRRRVRHLEITGAATVVVLCALLATLFVGTSPLAARYGASSTTTVSGYPSRIGQQWPILDLPAKPGPIAGLVSNGVDWWAVSPTGHRWKVPGIGGSYPALSPDGRMLGYIDRSNRLVVHDLVSGRTVANPDVGQQDDQTESPHFRVQDQTQALFSTDDRFLAFSGSFGRKNGTVVVNATTGRVVDSSPRNGLAFTTGWSGDSVVTAYDVAELRAMSDGSVRRVVLHATRTLPSRSQNSAVTSADGSQLVVMTGGRSNGGPQTMTRFSLETGKQLGQVAAVPSIRFNGLFNVGKNVVYEHQDPGTQQYSVVAVDQASKPSIVTSIRAGSELGDSVWAAEAFDGSARSPMLADRVASRIIVWRTAFVWSLIGLLSLGGLLWICWAARRKADPVEVEPVTARTTTKRWLGALLVVGVFVATALLLAVYVVRVVGTGNLTSSQPALWWLQGDQDLATPTASDGDPASAVPLRMTTPATAQGILVLVENRTGRSQRIVASAPGAYTTAVATTAGNKDQARSLAYAASATVPAHQSRWVRALLTSGCMDKGMSATLPSLAITVHVGWLSRKEDIPLRPQMQLVAKTKIAPAGQNCGG